MTQDSQQKHTSRNKMASVGFWLYRLGIVFSAALAFMQGIYDMGSRTIMRRAETASNAQNGLLKYESPSFRLFGEAFVGQALAGAYPVGQIIQPVPGTSTATGCVPPPPCPPGAQCAVTNCQ